ncbi:MAG TPA: DUF6064 family protein [Bauldia sp.]|nr:DUF6064 family protein [Bauldia sp.]
MLPFSREAFLSVIVDYNQAIWPAQIVAYLVGLAAIGALVWRKPFSDRAIAGALAAMWLVTGAAYHAMFFTAINPAAYLFAAAFILEAGVLVYCGMFRGQLRFGFDGSPAAWVGAAFLAYAGLAYPLLAIATGHAYPELPMFGLTPCPVTIFTFGLFLMTTQRVPRVLFVIPFLWSLVGGSAAFLLNIVPDWFLLASGVIALAMLLPRDRLRAMAA